MTQQTIDGQDVTVKRIYPHNAFLVRQYLEKFDDASNEMVAWDDATNVKVSFATDKNGDDVITNMGPFDMAAVHADHPGYYSYTVPASVTALLDVVALRGSRIWQIVTAGSADELRVATPLLVTEPRYAE